MHIIALAAATPLGTSFIIHSIKRTYKAALADADQLKGKVLALTPANVKSYTYLNRNVANQALMATKMNQPIQVTGTPYDWVILQDTNTTSRLTLTGLSAITEALNLLAKPKHTNDHLVIAYTQD